MKLDVLRGSQLTRRTVLFGGGALGVAAVAEGADAVSAPSQKWPWRYVKLDPQATAEIAYQEWYRIFCGAAVISAVFGQLREKVGEPYRSFPVEAFGFLEGGIAGWGTVCGACAGSNVVCNMILGPRTASSEEGMLMGSELLQHYASTALPTFVPKAPKTPGEIPKTVSRSPLCHLSVGKWMKASGKPLASPERMDRCARVTASMTREVVTLLNAWKDGAYRTQGIIPGRKFGIQAQHNCTDCHTDGEIPQPPKKI